MVTTSSAVDVRPVTADRWPDMVELFGDNGASSGCWCMWFRIPPRTWSANGNAGNRAAMQSRIDSGDVPGLLAYRDGKPVGWISVAPRVDYERIEGSGDKAWPADGPVWSVVCFFMGPGVRGQGVGTALLSAAVEHARQNGAKVLEAYPVERANASNAEAFTGPRSMFEKAGFRETGRFDRWAAVPHASGEKPRSLVRPPGRPVMRLDL